MHLLPKIYAGIVMLNLASSTLFAAGEIKVISQITIPMQRYGSQWQNTRTLFLVKDHGDEVDKKVKIIFESNAETLATDAQYIGPSAEGYELWIAYTNVPFGEYQFHLESSLGETGDVFPLKAGPILFQNQKIQNLNAGAEFYNNDAACVVAVQNIAYQKHIRVVYSFDNFATEANAPLDFVPDYYYGYGFFRSPSLEGVELWTGQIKNIPQDVTSIRYYFQYEVDGKSYTDDNYGAFYTMKRAPIQ